MTLSCLSTLDRTLTDSTWDAFLAHRPDVHILQHRLWGELKARFGWRAERVAIARQGQVLAGAQILFRRLPWGQTLAYIPKGPIIPWEEMSLVRELQQALIATARRLHAALLLIEPDLPDDPQASARLAALGWRPSHRSVQPRSTIVIGLDGDDETLLGRMKPKWRYNVRLAARKGVTVRMGTPADLPAVYALMQETARRDRFAIHVADYYAAAYGLFVPAGLAAWLLAEHEDRLLAAIVTFAHGERAWYFWGASASEGRSLMPNHALQWAAMRWARDRGCRAYDLWGVPDEVGRNPEAYATSAIEPSDGLWGVYRFKQGFGGRVVRFVGAWERPLSPMGYALYRLGLRLRRVTE
ncbi:MAG: peptidoglycan bridge formation glycyltransferase FemA/FemB family protein [Anaerolineae bacterium]|nr:peptidoglycan bridge formation glycyltransferase FemA/FemB family protein [Anaerolineae bacterium]MDW8098452.1 peptidoglycan bridge formation glycyltransferase FemA/FemB family protein [Anaerolineae bacterium]